MDKPVFKPEFDRDFLPADPGEKAMSAKATYDLYRNYVNAGFTKIEAMMFIAELLAAYNRGQKK